MDPKFDLAKLVGAASAPVALIIATCIYLGNLLNQYNTYFTQIKTLAQELRENPDQKERADSLREQLKLYEQRICGSMRAGFWLNIAILCFIGTVLFTGVAMLFPGNIPIMLFTTGLMFVGLVIVAYAIGIEVWSNRVAKPAIDTDLSVGTPNYEPVTAGQK